MEMNNDRIDLLTKWRCLRRNGLCDFFASSSTCKPNILGIDVDPTMLSGGIHSGR
jgi:hypothetical protein